MRLSNGRNISDFFIHTGCDETITEDMQFVKSLSPYENNQDCVYNVTNPDGGCINLIFLNFELEPGTTSSVCDNDYLTVSIMYTRCRYHE